MPPRRRQHVVAAGIQWTSRVGIAHVPEMLDLGMKVGMGLDDQACTDVADPWQNMRIGHVHAARPHP